MSSAVGARAAMRRPLLVARRARARPTTRSRAALTAARRRAATVGAGRARSCAPGRRPGRRRPLRLDGPAPGRGHGRPRARPRPARRGRPPGPALARRAGRRSTSPSGAGRAASSRGLLRQHGARGSGKSIGDTVCVRPWQGDGYCAVVEAADPTRYRLRVSRVVGCAAGCAPEPSCSAGRAVGAGGLGAGDVAVGARPPASRTRGSGDGARRGLAARWRGARRAAPACGGGARARRRPTPTRDASAPAAPGSSTTASPTSPGGTTSTATRRRRDSRRALAATGAGWGGLLTTWYMETKASNDIPPVADRSNDDDVVRRAIDEMHALGLKVMLKPHVDVRGRHLARPDRARRPRPLVRELRRLHGPLRGDRGREEGRDALHRHRARLDVGLALRRAVGEPDRAHPLAATRAS